jgi:hypothetical protein
VGAVGSAIARCKQGFDKLSPNGFLNGSAFLRPFTLSLSKGLAETL